MLGRRCTPRFAQPGPHPRFSWTLTCLCAADDCFEIRHGTSGAIDRRAGRHSEGCGQLPGACWSATNRAVLRVSLVLLLLGFCTANRVVVTLLLVVAGLAPLCPCFAACSIKPSVNHLSSPPYCLPATHCPVHLGLLQGEELRNGYVFDGIDANSLNSGGWVLIRATAPLFS